MHFERDLSLQVVSATTQHLFTLAVTCHATLKKHDQTHLHFERGLPLHVRSALAEYFGTLNVAGHAMLIMARPTTRALCK